MNPAPEIVKVLPPTNEEVTEVAVGVEVQALVKMEGVTTEYPNRPV